MRGALAALAVMAGMVAGTPAHAAVTVVAPPNLHSWKPFFVDAAVTQPHSAAGGATFVEGPADPPSGAGSVRLVTGPGHGAGGAGVRSTTFSGTRLDAITTLSYSTYVENTTGGEFPYLRLTLDLDDDGTRDDEIFFEPSDQSMPPAGVLPQQAPQTHTWQTWNARTGVWRVRGRLAGFAPRSRLMSLDAIIAGAPSATIVNNTDGSGGVRIVSGDVADTARFDGNVDDFTIGGDGALTTYDFERSVGGPAVRSESVPPAVKGESAVVTAVEGTITVTPPGKAPHGLESGGENLPLGTIVDATKGKVAITTAATEGGTPQTAVFYGATFTVDQRGGTRPVTEITLRSPRYAALCGRSAAAFRAAASGRIIPRAQRRRSRSKRVVVSLWGDGKGRFRTKGRNSAATVRGTRWLTQERCDGTLTRVTRGVVDVWVKRTGKVVTVRAGRSYLAEQR